MSLQGSHIFITGGQGFIGSHLCERLVTHNHVTVYDSGARDALRFTGLAAHPHLRVVRGDILDGGLLRASAQGADIVIHLAAVAGVSNYYDRPVETMRTNMLGTSEVLEMARALQPRLFVNVSTSEVYGPEADHVRETDATRQGPVKVSRWTYSVSKLAGEHLCFAYHREHRLPVVSIRPFNIYGPRQVGEGAIQSLASRALRHEPLEIHNDGRQVRAWCFIDDFVEGCLACLSSPQVIGEVLNLGNPSATVTVEALARMVQARCASRSELRFVSFEPEGEIPLRVPCIETAERLIGFQPRVSLEEGLGKTIDWYRDVLLPHEGPASLGGGLRPR